MSDNPIPPEDLEILTGNDGDLVRFEIDASCAMIVKYDEWQFRYSTGIDIGSRVERGLTRATTTMYLSAEPDKYEETLAALAELRSAIDEATSWVTRAAAYHQAGAEWIEAQNG